jgi:hypothetical protein
MKMKYNAVVPRTIYVTVEVEADSRDEAEQLAEEAVNLQVYVGNGAFDRLCGVTEGSLEVGEGYDCCAEIEITPADVTVEELVESFRKSDHYDDYRNDGLAYHIQAWLQEEEISADVGPIVVRLHGG